MKVLENSESEAKYISDEILVICEKAIKWLEKQYSYFYTYLADNLSVSSLVN